MEKITKIFIANTTKQNWVFTYRFAEMNSHFAKAIPPGKQICLDHLTSDQIAKVIEQNEVYGMKPAAEMSRRKGFTGLCYRLGEPVQMDRMLETYDLNDLALNAAAQERRVTSAQAASDGIAISLNQLTGLDKEKLRPVSVSSEVVEETDGKPQIDVVVEVPRNPETKSRRARMSG